MTNEIRPLIFDPENYPEDRISNENKLGDMKYSYLDMLDAWIAGKKNEQSYNSGDGDAPDFITWLKQHVNDKDSISK